MRSNSTIRRLENEYQGCKKLQHIFKEQSNSICLRLITKGYDIESSEYMKQCTIFTGEAVEETAIIIARELSIKTI